MSIQFGAITTSVKYTDSPTSNSIANTFDIKYGNRSGTNLFMTEEAMKLAAQNQGKGHKLFDQF